MFLIYKMRLLLTILLLTLAKAELKEANDLYMTGSVIKYYGHYYNALKLFMGSGENKAKTPIWLSIMIGRNNTIIGDSDQVNWGIKCPKDQPEKDNSCQASGVNYF